MPFTKKDALPRLFLCPLSFPVYCFLFSISAALADTACHSDLYSEQFDEISKIRYIHDGDTLHLIDGRKVRLIGINTPELALDNRPAEPYATEAKNALKSLFKDNKSIALIYGQDKKDRYGRMLAHALLADGQNVQAQLLKQGYASVIAVPPNTKFTACYLEMEHEARCNSAGRWKSATILEAKNLKKQHTGFHLIQGTVESIKTNRKGIWLNLDNTLTIGIRPDNQPLFDIGAINKMINQSIIVRGWLNKSNKSTPFYMRVQHPLSIQLASSYACDL